MAKKINLIGKTFGFLTVVADGEKKLCGIKRQVLRSTWICNCICGNVVTVLSSNLRTGNSGTQSCGCKFKKSKKYNFKDLSGIKYGYLTVINKTNEMTKTRGVVWNCLCDCGNYINVPTNSLTSHNKITCGDKANHTKNNLDPRHKRYEGFPLVHFTAIINGATARNLEFKLTPKYLWELFINQNEKCALSGVKLMFTQERAACTTRKQYTTASLDRIDSSIGYLEGNVRWVHKDVNRMRSNFNDKTFLDYCEKCYLNNNNKRPSFDEYFLNLSKSIATRSDDPDIKHGAIIVSNQNHIIGTGYNATVKGSDIDKIPLNIRDEKRLWMIHAEENAILNCTVNPLTIGGAKMYITASPCFNCLQRIINFGITEITYFKIDGSITENEKTKEMKNTLINMSNLNIREIEI